MLHRNTRRTGRKSPRSVIEARVSPNQRDECICDFLESLDSPRSLMVWMLYKWGEHHTLVKLSIDPLHYDDPDDFRAAYCATKFLSKTTGLKTGIDLKGVAIESARAAELQCLASNKRIYGYRTGLVTNPHSSEWFRAAQIVATILGPVPDEFQDTGWSKGRTTSCRGNEVASVYKYTGRLDVTWSAQRGALRLLRASPKWGAAALKADGPCSVLAKGLELTKGNILITVPKSAKTDRVICYEPHMNIRLQRNVGVYIERRLMLHGINLNDQSINQRRAQLASFTGHLATIDLSMASDTLPRELVTELLPCEWVDVLNDLRSRYTLWPGEETYRENEKFSSMGNGFTFELESLIFFAIASAVSKDVSVFGDDIICPTDSFESVKAALEGAGFLLNTGKSFATGRFRESCGMDSFGGVDCTPVYLRSLPKTREDIIKLHNASRLWWSKSRLRGLHIASMLRKWRDIHTVHLGPSGQGDGHYHVNFEEACPTAANLDDGWCGWWFTTYNRIFRSGRLYGDRVSGHFSDEYAWSALCASLGPKHPRDIVMNDVDRRLVIYKRHRGYSIQWSSVVWET